MSRAKVGGGAELERQQHSGAHGWDSAQLSKLSGHTSVHYSLGGGIYLRPDIPLIAGSGAPIGVVEESKCSSQRQRRARILAVARKLLLQTDSEAFTVREVAEQSDVTVPTIYNLVGGRTEVMLAAVKEQYLANLGLYKKRAAAGNAPSIFFLIDHHNEVTACYTNYVRQIFLSAFADNRQNPLSEGIAEMIRFSYSECMYAMSKRGQFKASADIDLLTSTLTSVHVAFTRMWATGHMGLDDKQRLFECDAVMKLRGAVVDHLIPCIDRRLSELQGPYRRLSAKLSGTC